MSLRSFFSDGKSFLSLKYLSQKLLGPIFRPWHAEKLFPQKTWSHGSFSCQQFQVEFETIFLLAKCHAYVTIFFIASYVSSLRVCKYLCCFSSSCSSSSRLAGNGMYCLRTRESNLCLRDKWVSIGKPPRILLDSLWKFDTQKNGDKS